MLHSNNKYTLQWISEEKKPNESRVDLQTVTKIYFGTENFHSFRDLKSTLTDQGKLDLCISLIH